MPRSIPKLTLPAERRLKKQLDFAAAREEGVKYYSPHLIIYIRKSSLDFPRLGVVVSKKVSKRAVDRNLIKRRLREIFRLNQHDLAKVDLVLIAKKNILAADYQDLSDGLLKALKQAKALV